METTVLKDGDSGYDEARTVWNAMVDRRPRMIFKATRCTDVSNAVRTARDLGLEIGVRCGGHSSLGLAVPDDGLMIDLTPMDAVSVDPVTRTARVQGGALLAELDRASQRHGLAVTAGNVSHTGVGGLTLGGGMGWLARQYGLTCDNVLSFTMVTADGDLVVASAEENPELFWGLRGGGGNFGVVTEFEFRLHDIGTRTLTAEFDVHTAEALPAMSRWRDLNAEAPRQATFTADVRAERTTVGFVWVGDPADAAPWVSALRAAARPFAERITTPSYVGLQTREDTVERHAVRRYSKGHYLAAFPDAAIEALLTGGGGLQAYGGAIADVPDDATAFSHRQTLFEYGTGAGWRDPADDERHISAARHRADLLTPYASGVYVNALTDEGAEGVGRAYSRDKLTRLAALKKVWDPENVFHLNQNIKPA